MMNALILTLCLLGAEPKQPPVITEAKRTHVEAYNFKSDKAIGIKLYYTLKATGWQKDWNAFMLQCDLEKKLAQDWHLARFEITPGMVFPRAEDMKDASREVGVLDDNQSKEYKLVIFLKIKPKSKASRDDAVKRLKADASLLIVKDRQ